MLLVHLQFLCLATLAELVRRDQATIDMKGRTVVDKTFTEASPPNLFLNMVLNEPLYQSSNDMASNTIAFDMKVEKPGESTRELFSESGQLKWRWQLALKDHMDVLNALKEGTADLLALTVYATRKNPRQRKFFLSLRLPSPDGTSMLFGAALPDITNTRNFIATAYQQGWIPWFTGQLPAILDDEEFSAITEDILNYEHTLFSVREEEEDGEATEAEAVGTDGASAGDEVADGDSAGDVGADAGAAASLEKEAKKPGFSFPKLMRNFRNGVILALMAAGQADRSALQGVGPANPEMPTDAGYAYEGGMNVNDMYTHDAPGDVALMPEHGGAVGNYDGGMYNAGAFNGVNGGLPTFDSPLAYGEAQYDGHPRFAPGEGATFWHDPDGVPPLE